MIIIFYHRRTYFNLQSFLHTLDYTKNTYILKLFISFKNAAILLTNSKTLNEDTREYIKANTNIKNIIIVGGEKSISSSVEDELKTLR